MGKTGESGNKREIKFSGTCDCVTLMQVVSVVGQILTALVILPLSEAKYRKQVNDKYETPSEFLPKHNHLFMRPIAGVYYKFFYAWAQYFVKKTEHLRR